MHTKGNVLLPPKFVKLGSLANNMNAYFLVEPARAVREREEPGTYDKSYFRVRSLSGNLAMWLERNEVSRKEAESLTLEARRYGVDQQDVPGDQFRSHPKTENVKLFLVGPPKKSRYKNKIISKNFKINWS